MCKTSRFNVKCCINMEFMELLPEFIEIIVITGVLGIEWNLELS